ncbi:unnamed protein product, partial [Rotaria socialis]
MPIDLCAHPVAHPSTTKLGCRPSHPRGDRILHAELTRHISETYGMIDETGQFLTGYHLCRTCYEKEYAIYNAKKSHQQNMGEDGGEMMYVDDENTENQRQLHSTTNDLSMADYQMNEKFESSTPESITGSEDSDDIEHGHRQQQAKHILNKVFQALSITPILDTRDNGALKRDVTRAIQGIRKLANELCHVPNTKTLKSNVTLLATEENELLIDGLKRLFGSSDYDDQVRLLTLSPPTWGRVQIENFYFCNEWQSRRALEIRGSFGILATPTNFSGNPRINPLLVDEIQAFYQEDIISRQTSNKKDVIHVKKQPIPVRF